MARRGVWTGSISFGLVSVGVKALTAVHDHDVHFHQIERETGARIGNQKVSKETGEPVDTDDIEMGYEVTKGRYVAFDPSEIEELRPESTRTVDVTDFVDLSEIDPVYFERTYWLAPTDEGAEHAYRLLAAAMDRSQKVGIGTVVMRNKQYLAAIRPVDGALAMSTMHFADEVEDITDVEEIPTGGAAPSEKELALADQVIEALAADWDPTRYEDTFTEELKELIEARDRGDEVTTEPEGEEESEGAEVIDLMAALQASVDEARAGRSSAKKTGAKKSSAKKSSAKKTGAKKSSAKKSSTTTTRSSSRKKAATKKKAAAKKKAASKQPAAKKKPASKKKAAASTRGGTTTSSGSTRRSA